MEKQSKTLHDASGEQERITVLHRLKSGLEYARAVNFRTKITFGYTFCLLYKADSNKRSLTYYVLAISGFPIPHI